MTDNSPTLGGLSVVSADMEASIAFYERLGLTVNAHPDWRAHHVTAEAGGATVDIDSVAMTKTYDASWDDAGGVVLIFRVPTREAVDDAYQRVVAGGATEHTAPFDAFWGARYAVVEDPDGNPVGIMSPSDEAKGGPPPKL